MNIGILTSGGDCAGLNSVMYGFAKAIAISDLKAKIFGISNGWTGLINRDYREMKPEEFFGLLNTGGTIIGSSRQPLKVFTAEEKLGTMKENYKNMDLDCLLTLGGQGTHKKAAILANEGLNIIGLPKTIDNDIFGTDFSFGFHTAVDVAAECIDRVRTTAASHHRTMVVEIMGNKVGWLTLHAGMAGGADVILIPEIPFDTEKVIKAATKAERENGYCIIAAAEGALSKEEAEMSKKERTQKREEKGEKTASERIAKAVAESLNLEARVVVPGYTQRGGNPGAYDRIICTQMGAYAAKLVEEKKFGVSVAIQGTKIIHNSLSDVAGETKFIPKDSELVQAAKAVGISFGD